MRHTKTVVSLYTCAANISYAHSPLYKIRRARATPLTLIATRDAAAYCRKLLLFLLDFLEDDFLDDFLPDFFSLVVVVSSSAVSSVVSDSGPGLLPPVGWRVFFTILVGL